MNKIQKIRKEQNFQVTDRISVKLEKKDWLEPVVKNYFDYICTEILAEELIFQKSIKKGLEADVNDMAVKVLINRINHN